MENEKTTSQLLEDLAIMVAQGFERVEKRFETMENRFETMEKKFEEIDMKFERVFVRLDTIDDKVTNIRYDFRKINEADLISRVGILEEKVGV